MDAAVRHTFVSSVAALLLATGVASANQAARMVSWSGTEITIAAGEFADILNDGGTSFSAADMMQLDQALQADGIQTQGHISILLAQTSEGLSLITLLDGVQILDPPGTPTIVTTTSFVPTTATWQYNVDAGGSVDSFPLGDQVVLNGAFLWQSGIESEAMAISNLLLDDIGSLALNQLLAGGLDPNGTIQLLTSQGGTWMVADSFDFEPADAGGPDFQYFDFEITIPAPTVLAVFGLAAVTRRRRRR
jgi:hypothetical protein